MTYFHNKKDEKMSNPKTEIIPTIKSNVFERPGSEGLNFALGMVANQGRVARGHSDTFYGALQLRGRVYHEKGFVALSDLDGPDTRAEIPDYDDMRSAHFVILERTLAPSKARLVGNMRLDIKGKNDNRLPIETYFPEVFEAEEARERSAEVTRLVLRHENAAMQSVLKWTLFLAGLRFVDERGLGPVFGVVEEKFASSLTTQQVPIKALAEKKYIADINAEKQPIEIDVPRLREVMGSLSINSQDVPLHNGRFTYLNFNGFGNDTHNDNTHVRKEAV